MAGIGEVMFAKIFCVITVFFLLIGNSYAQEESVALKQTSEVVSSYCGVSTAMEEARKDDLKIFAGIMNSHSILYLTLDKKGFWTVTIDNLSGISCIYFMGQSGISMIDMDKKKGIGFKGNIGRMING
jgi:hypothetical protein